MKTPYRIASPPPLPKKNITKRFPRIWSIIKLVSPILPFLLWIVGIVAATVAAVIVPYYVGKLDCYLVSYSIPQPKLNEYAIMLWIIGVASIGVAFLIGLGLVTIWVSTKKSRDSLWLLMKRFEEREL